MKKIHREGGGLLSLNRNRFFYKKVFVLSVVICTIVEYITSVIMEKMFNRRWWDYSQFRFNLNGRVCFKNSIEFGILGSAAVIFISPFLCKYINVPNLNIILTICTVIFILDILFSIIIMHKIKVQTQNITVNLKQDNTEQINEEVRKYILEKSILYKRVFRNFPGYKIQDTIKQISKEVNKQIKKIKKNRH